MAPGWAAVTSHLRYACYSVTIQLKLQQKYTELRTKTGRSTEHLLFPEQVEQPIDLHRDTAGGSYEDILWENGTHSTTLFGREAAAVRVHFQQRQSLTLLLSELQRRICQDVLRTAIEKTVGGVCLEMSR
jgi:hypothetical protein